MAYNTGATFYPGGDDSYYMPEVVAPAPQRLNEHPVNVEQNVASMEKQAASQIPLQISTQTYQTGNGVPSNHGPWSPTSPSNNQYSQPLTYNNTHRQPQSYNNQGPSQPYSTGQQSNNSLPAHFEQPNFSPFPVVKNRGSHVPPTDEEREGILEAAREAVLASDDFETQLTWAQDALAYVEISVQNEQHISQTQPARPRTPRVEHMLREDAMKVIEFLANQMHPKAQFLRGMWYEFGKFGHRVDKREAFNCYTKASERGYARAYYRIGMQFENSNDALKAIKYYQYGAEQGDAASCYRLGMMTLLGQHGQMQDFQRGLQLIQIASSGADENAPQGAYVLGMLQAGELVQVSVPDYLCPKDIASARMNIERAAFLGFAKAQVRMGSAYELGDLGCEFDPALSLHYNALAARQGEADAEMSISKWFLCGQENVFARNEEMAFTYAQRAALSGSGTAQFAMGYFYEVGIYVQTDLKQAREWYQKADENGNADAGKRIQAISRSKTISRKDHENIALQKIRQQHASIYGAPSMPMVQEEPATMPEKIRTPSLTMPDPALLSLNTNNNIQRPTSTAPYPVDGPGIPAHPSPSNFRPTSAFGINPALRTSSAMHAQSPRPDAHRIGSAPTPQPRPYANLSPTQPGPGYGQGGRPPVPNSNYPYDNQLHPQQRPSSASPYLNPQINPQQRPPSRTQPGQPLPAAPSKIDIGFSAPVDMSGPDGPNKRRPLPSQERPPRDPRVNQSLSPRPGGPQSHSHQQIPNTSFSSRPPNSTQKPPQQQSHHQQPTQPKPPPKESTPQSKPESSPHPPRLDSQKPKPNLNVSSKPSTVSASAAPVTRPGKGPKTFEEMGVPQAKKESDCIVM